MPAEAAPARPRWGRRLVAAAVVVAALVVVANLYLVSRTGDAVVTDLARTPPRPYALVLGAYVFRGGVPSLELVERLKTGLALYRAGLARKVIVSGAVFPGYDEPDVMAAWLEARGVAPADVIVDRGGYRTAASMADAARLGVKELLVVTQRYHLPRSLYLAEHAGMAALGVAAAEHVRQPIDALYRFVRETTARAEIIVEVTLRGVRGLPPDQIPQA